MKVNIGCKILSAFILHEGLAAVEAESEVGLFGGEDVVVVGVGAVGEFEAVAGGCCGDEVHEESPRLLVPADKGDIGRTFGVGVVAREWDGECFRGGGC